MSVYLCPRPDLGCNGFFPTTGELDYHLRFAHRYPHAALLWRSLRPVRTLPEPPASAGPEIATGRRAPELGRGREPAR